MYFISRRSPSQSSSLLPAPQSTRLAGCFEFLISICEDLAFFAQQLGLWRTRCRWRCEAELRCNA
jgi:hypothetical protein